MNYAIELEDITKRFPGVLANDHVNLSVKKGAVHALVGENGAGKSTLMNIIYGLYLPDSGSIRINGKKVVFHSPRDAIANGLGMVHQHFMLVPSYTVAENLVLGREPRKNGLFDRAKAEETTRKLSEQYHLEVDPKSVVHNLSVGTQQRVEILKALHFGADTIILDEPTAVLTPQEIDDLFNTIRVLVKDRKTVIFITHKLYEVKSISNQVTVLRKGKVIDTLPTKEVTENDLARMMVGEKMEPIPAKSTIQVGEKILEIKNLVVGDSMGSRAVRNVLLEVREGEIVTLAGVEGNGQTELVEAITGLHPIDSGKVYLRGKDITGKTPDEIRRQGLAHVPGDRISVGSNRSSSVAENLIARRHRQEPFSKKGWTNLQIVNKFAEDLVDRFNIKTSSINALASTLSGGNLQKVVVAREFTFQAPLLVVSQPTRGLDIASTRYIRDVLIEMRDNGHAIILVSTDLDEVFSVSDRILVMYQGEVVGEFTPEKTTREELGLYMIGARRQSKVESIA